jgi:hypothetical protein
MKTRQEVVDQIDILEQIMSQANVAEANLAELKWNDLIEVLHNTNWELQLADCDHLFFY